MGGFDLPAIAAPASQEPARLVVGLPLAEALERGLVVIQYRADTGMIVQTFFTVCMVSGQSLVSGVGADVKAPAECPDVRIWR
jgi:hypothetical protein